MTYPDRLPNLDDYYDSKYKDFMGTGNVGRMWSFIHRKMEKPFNGQSYSKILEVGAGNGEHLNAVKCEYGEYVASDIRFDLLAQNTRKMRDVTLVSADAEKLPFADNTFDRVIITCVLPHLNAPLKAVEELYRVAKTGGKITIYVPCEPGLVLRIVRFFSTSRKAKKMKIEKIGLIHYLEHRNYYLAIDTYVKEVNSRNNAKLESEYYPFRLLTWNCNLFKIYQITK